MTISDRRSTTYDRIVSPPAGARVTAGILEREGSAAHPDAKGLTIAALAEIHEFGLGVPERSFIRAWFDQHQPEIVAVLKGRLAEAARGRISYDDAINQFALWVQGSIQRRIRDGIPPPLAPETIRRKGSSVPLIDTGVLRSSITAKAEVL